MRFTKLPTLLVMLSFATAISAHDGEKLDEMMGEKEQFFQVIDRPALPFALADSEGKSVLLSDFSDKIVVLNFIFASCADVCPLHSEMIAVVQSKINITPMKEMVQFITVTTDPDVDTADVLRSYGKAHGLDPYNWTFLTGRPGDAENTTRDLAELYNLRFDPLDDGQQVHGVVTHVIDRGGRFAAKFHGLRFKPLNLVLYINGLTNARSDANEPTETSWRDYILELFR